MGSFSQLLSDVLQIVAFFALPNTDSQKGGRTTHCTHPPTDPMASARSRPRGDQKAMPVELSWLVLSGSTEEEPGAIMARRLPIRLFCYLVRPGGVSSWVFRADTARRSGSLALT